MTATADTIYVTVPGRPVPYSRTATTVDRAGRPRRVLPARYRAWRSRAGDAFAILRRGRTLTGPVAVDVVVYPDRVVCRFTPLEDGRPVGTPTGDIDNYAKAILDAAQSGRLLTDDRQVLALHARFATNAERDATA